MKNLKKLITILMSAIMLMTFGIPAGAENDATATDKGSITVDNAVKEITYSIYKIFDLETTSDGTGYKYTVAEGWAEFVTGDGAGAEYVNVKDGVVSWKSETAVDSDVQKFAQAAVAYAKDNNITAVASKLADSSTIKFENLDKGYYLLSTNLGPKASTTTVVDKDVIVKGKNAAPSIEKEVKENSTGEWGKSNDANIGDTVEFKATIKVTDGNPTNYVMHDLMSDGLTFDKVSKVLINGEEVSSYDVKEECSSCTFQVHFNDVKTNDVIEVYYQATLNEKAIIAGEGNPNEVVLKYGDNNETEHDFTRTYTWKFAVKKVNSKNAALAGAKFQLKDANDNLIKFTKENDKEVYRVDPNGTVETITTTKTGAFNFTGLDSGTYSLVETEAPEGYNKLEEPVTVTIDNEGNINVTEDNPGGVKEVTVVNLSGNELPSTGGMGTTIFYIIGSILVLCAVVVLVVKKRMGNQN